MCSSVVILTVLRSGPYDGPFRVPRTLLWTLGGILSGFWWIALSLLMWSRTRQWSWLGPGPSFLLFPFPHIRPLSPGRPSLTVSPPPVPLHQPLWLFSAVIRPTGRDLRVGGVEPPQNLLEYLNGFRCRLYKAQETAKDKLSSEEGKIKNFKKKNNYDPQVENRVFLRGDQVLALLPILTFLDHIQ